MKIGVVYPQTELEGNPIAVKEIGLATEDLGYDHLLAYDHVVGAIHEDREPELWGPYTNEDPFHCPFTMFSYLAGITQKIEFVTGVIILPQRQTALVAKQTTDIDLLSGERLRLGVGTGWNYVEYDALGQDFSARGPRLSEQIELLRKYWSEDLFRDSVIRFMTPPEHQPSSVSARSKSSSVICERTSKTLLVNAFEYSGSASS